MIKIAFFSFADIDNFGDTLFSHIFKLEMEKRFKSLQIDFYTPSEYSAEGINYFSYNREKIIKNDYDALIVFGGEVVHLYDDRTWKPIYRKKNVQLESDLPSDVIFNWTDISKPFRAWLSVGVRPIENENDYLKINSAIATLDYLSVRGILSKKILEGNKLEFNNTKIEVTPDMGWLFPEILIKNNQKGKFYKKHTKSNNYLVFQINRITNYEAKEIGRYLKNFQERHEIDIVFLPIMRPYEDFKYLKLIFEEFPTRFCLLDNNLSILELTDIIVHAKIVLSSSLHVNITALSAGIPAGIINKWQGTKLQDICAHQFRLNFLKHQFDEIPDLLENLLKEISNTELLSSYSTFMKNSLSKIFDDLSEKILDSTNKCKGI